MSITIIMMAILAILVLVQLGLSIVQARRLQKITLALAAYSTLQQELLGSTGNALLSVHATVTAMEKKLSRTVQRQQELENKDAVSLTFEQATKLIHMGAAAEDLVKTCGLSQAEARLVSLMAARGIGKAS
jgi:type II secretory pathway pseudopilin PulG